MFILLIVLVFIFLSPISNSEAAVDLGVSIGEEGVRGFYLAVSDYYRVPEREVIVVRERHIPDEELPVVFFIAQRAHVRPATIIDLRMRGRTWMDVTLHFGLGPEIFYVPVKEGFVTGPPYGKAYGYYKKKPRKEWRKIVLDDNDVINLVNLRFISYHYGYEPEKVMKMREGGRNFIMINDAIAKEKKGKKEKTGEKREKGKEKYKGNGKGKGKKF
jgi:hypothetical protein